jgi:hypothetical protein
MDEGLVWALIGYALFPIWLVAGVLDYWLHQRTHIAATAGPRESRLHLAQTLQVGIPVLIVLFLELNLLTLALLVAAAVAHTITSYWDIRYASQRRAILPLEQVVHAFMLTLPIFVPALLLIMHWQVIHAPARPGAGTWALRWRDPPWDGNVIVTVLVTSFVFGMLPALAEYWQVKQANRRLQATDGPPLSVAERPATR